MAARDVRSSINRIVAGGLTDDKADERVDRPP